MPGMRSAAFRSGLRFDPVRCGFGVEDAQVVVQEFAIQRETAARRRFFGTDTRTSTWPRTTRFFTMRRESALS